MDPITVYYLGRIRQQEFLDEAEELRYSIPIWERLWDRIAPMIAARRQKARSAAAEALEPCVTAPSAIVDNC
jgi:hypothetical protein